jgi:hypothetical protein
MSGTPLRLVNCARVRWIQFGTEESDARTFPFQPCSDAIAVAFIDVTGFGGSIPSKTHRARFKTVHSRHESRWSAVARPDKLGSARQPVSAGLA